MKSLCLALALLLAGLAPAAAQITPPTTIEIIAPWARATPGGAQTAAAYMTLMNKGAGADRLLAVATPVAKTAALHKTENRNGVMQMLPVEGVDLPPGSQAVFKPGGYHIMLMGLTHPLAEGQSFPLTLTFAKAGEITVAVKVRKVGAMGAGMSGMPQDMGGNKSE